MTRHWHPTLKRIVRWLKLSAESFAAAAAVYGPDLMLQLRASPFPVPWRRPRASGSLVRVAVVDQRKGLT